MSESVAVDVELPEGPPPVTPHLARLLLGIAGDAQAALPASGDQNRSPVPGVRNLTPDKPDDRYRRQATCEACQGDGDGALISTEQPTSARVSVPYDEACEQGVVGWLLHFPGDVRAVSEVLSPSDFYVPRLRRIFAAQIELCGGYRRDYEWLVAWPSMVALAAGVPSGDVEWLSARAVTLGTRWWRVHRLRRLGANRIAMGLLDEAYRLLGAGADLTEVAPLIEQIPS